MTFNPENAGYTCRGFNIYYISNTSITPVWSNVTTKRCTIKWLARLSVSHK